MGPVAAWIAFLIVAPQTDRMKELKLKTFAWLMLVLVADFAFADSRRILLQDGTEIVGEILSMEQGSYTIRTQALGTLRIADRQIKQISNLGSDLATKATSSGNPLETGKMSLHQGQIQAIQNRLTGDSAMLQRIMSLQSSPEMKAVLSDPEVMAAIQRFDFEALSKHPKIKALMNNQSVQSLTDSVN